MKKGKQLIFIVVLCFIFLAYFSIEQKEKFMITKKSVDEEYQALGIRISQFKKIKNDFFGTWQIDRVAMISEMYTGTTLDGGREEDLFEPEDYIGYELEYSPKFIRVGEVIYKNPIYRIWIQDEGEIQYGGRFFPTIGMVIEEEGIEVDYFNIPIIFIKFKQKITYQKYNFIPVGAQCILLDKNTLLLGIWGKILLAHRISEYEGTGKND